jgi:hypothetical protein
MPKPDAISENPDGLGFSIDDPTVENQKLDANSNIESPVQNHPDDAAGEPTSVILDQIDQIPSNDPAQEGDPELHDGVVRPADYHSDTPGDMGMTEDAPEDQPDLSGVLQEGLDSNADDIQKERVMQMVGEALQGFKGCKAIIEQAQQQTPQLYSASLAMLKAMIEMARMLGLDQSGEQELQNPLESQAAPGEPQDSPMPPAESVSAASAEAPAGDKGVDSPMPPAKLEGANAPPPKPKG